jgi:hypothetical protein
MKRNLAASQARMWINRFLYRILYHINRTFLAWGIKVIASAFCWKWMAERRQVARGMVISKKIGERAEIFNRDGSVLINDLVDPDLLAEMASASEQKLSRADELISRQTLTHKSFWIRLLDEDKLDGRLASENVFVRFAIQPSILQLVTAILGDLPLLTDVLLTLSREANGKLSYSQLWHRDHDDPRTVKLFVYLTDVKGREDGPFTFLPKSISDAFGFSLHSHLPDDKVFQYVDRKAVREMIAPKLTAFMVETSRCMHMGSRMAPDRSRLLYSAIFVLPPRVYPTRVDLFRVTTPLSMEQRFALGCR